MGIGIHTGNALRGYAIRWHDQSVAYWEQVATGPWKDDQSRRTPPVGDEVDRPSSVPEIVPAGSQNLASGANCSQLARSRNLLKRLDLLAKTKMAEMLIGSLANRRQPLGHLTACRTYVYARHPAARTTHPQFGHSSTRCREDTRNNPSTVRAIPHVRQQTRSSGCKTARNCGWTRRRRGTRIA